jgi:hypothetical protein
MCAPEEHDSILCKRFHRYLNKVQMIKGANAQTFEHWIMNKAMATYAWNTSPVDGTYIIRSIAAKARIFRFPLDIQDEETGAIRIPSGEGEAAIQHVETVVPLWFQQKGLLKLLQETRRARHLQMKNENRTERKFNPGDLVLIRKQVKSSALEGRPEELTIKAKGPYRVLEKAGKSSYWLHQKLPALQGTNRKRGKQHKEAAFRMTKIPSTVIIHKRLDSTDTRLMRMKGEIVHNPLEQNLGLFDFRSYHQADPNAPYAFEQVNQIWQEDIDTDESGNEEDDISTGDEVEHQHQASVGETSDE